MSLSAHAFEYRLGRFLGRGFTHYKARTLEFRTQKYQPSHRSLSSGTALGPYMLVSHWTASAQCLVLTELYSHYLEACQPKIAQLGFILRINQNVMRLNISVSKSMLVQVVEGLYHLPCDIRFVGRCQRSLSAVQKIEKCTFLAVLHHEHQRRGLRYYSDQKDDIRMAISGEIQYLVIEFINKILANVGVEHTFDSNF